MVTFDDRVESCRAALEAAAREAGMYLSGDGRVSEQDAARLLGLSPGHLKRLRQDGAGPVAYMVGMNGCRLSYRTRDLAAWVELGREQF